VNPLCLGVLVAEKSFSEQAQYLIKTLQTMFNKYIICQFLDTTLKYSQNNAFCINEEYFSYIIFIQRIAAIAKSLQNNAETDIALVANDDLDTYAAIFAIWLTGKMYVPLNPDTPVERNQNIIDQVCIKTILNSSETAALPSPDFEASVNWLETCVKDSDFDNQLAYIFFTSGSTGTPKGVMITKKNVAAFVEAFRAMGYDITKMTAVCKCSTLHSICR
jgi:D-alanine--poly(phosphoribitol) ligase subunit 1